MASSVGGSTVNASNSVRYYQPIADFSAQSDCDEVLITSLLNFYTRGLLSESHNSSITETLAFCAAEITKVPG